MKRKFFFCIAYPMGGKHCSLLKEPTRREQCVHCSNYQSGHEKPHYPLPAPRYLSGFTQWYSNDDGFWDKMLKRLGY